MLTRDMRSFLSQGLRHGARVCYANDGRTPIATCNFSNGSGCLWIFRDKCSTTFAFHCQTPILTPTRCCYDTRRRLLRGLCETINVR